MRWKSVKYVYREFKDVSTFMDEIAKLLKK